ncbi:MAG: DUF2066 domain-containing protein [Steroidobacteraceae bacterium]
MRKPIDTNMPAPLFRCALRLALLVVAMLGSAARAEMAVYQAQVPLPAEAGADRTAALGEALKVAAVRASGRADAANSPKIEAAAASPAAYVQQYSTTPDRMLKVGFDARAMDSLLLQAGLPLWPAERPTVTVYLYRAGDGAQPLTAADRSPERIEAERAAQARGVPIAWPIEAVDVATARARSGGNMATLVGAAAGGGYDWSFAHAGQTTRGQGSVTQGVGFAADELARRYATPATGSVAKFGLRIGGLNGVRDYAALTQYLEGLSLVRDVAVRELGRDAALVDLAVRGDRQLLARIFALDGRIVPAPAASGADSAAAVDFVWQTP